MQIVITVAGLGQRFIDEGYSQPKPIVPVMGKPAIHYLIESFDPEWELIFAIGEHYKNPGTNPGINQDKNSDIEDVIRRACPNSVVVYVPHSVRGPVDTVLAVMPLLNPKKSVAVSYCDYAMIWQPAAFAVFLEKTNCDICIPAYRGFHPTYLGPNTYAHLQAEEETNRVMQIQEKKLFGNHIEDEWSSPGFYFFKSVELLKKGIELQLKFDMKHGSEFYTSLAAQALMNQDSSLKVISYPVSHFLQMGTPTDLAHVEYWHKYIVLDHNANAFIPGSKEDKLFCYWDFVFKNLA